MNHSCTHNYCRSSSTKVSVLSTVKNESLMHAHAITAGRSQHKFQCWEPTTQLPCSAKPNAEAVKHVSSWRPQPAVLQLSFVNCNLFCTSVESCSIVTTRISSQQLANMVTIIILVRVTITIVHLSSSALSYILLLPLLHGVPPFLGTSLQLIPQGSGPPSLSLLTMFKFPT